MIHEKIIEILEKIEYKVKELKKLNNYWQIDTNKLINDSKVILLLASKLYKKVNDYY